jgi:membrane protein required for colicin V production
MIWFDYLALGIIAYFVIRGFLSGFIKTICSFIGMIVAFLYSGWLSIKITPYVAKFLTNNPKILPILSFIFAFILIYLSFILLGFILVTILGKMHLSIADYFLGGILGFIKASLFITLLYLLLIIPYPPFQKTLNKALTYPIIRYTLKISSDFLPQKWKNFLKEKGVKLF